MRSYHQYCPIARAAEVLAERWTLVILRNMLLGATTFSEIAGGAPGIPRSLLSSRLQLLERAGIVERKGRGGRGVYGLTRAGEDLGGVMLALGTWGERWIEIAPQHRDPGMVLHAWCAWYLATDLLPPERVVVRFEFPDLASRGGTLWIVFDGERSEVCRQDPGFPESLFVTAESQALVEWHLGRLEWGQAVRSGRIVVDGPPRLARALPTWSRRSGWARLGIHPQAGELVQVPSR